MKKLTLIVAIAAITAITFSGCGKQTPKPNIKNEIDTLSYALGIAQSQGLKEYIQDRYGVDTTYMDEFFKGLTDGVNAGDNKKKAAYFAGINIGQQVANQMLKGINHELFGNDSTKSISLNNFMAGFVTGTAGKKGLLTPDSAANLAQIKIQEIKKKSMLEQYGANKVAGEKFLAENANKEGVTTLPDGVQYKIIKAGTGEVPTDSSLVKVNYEGRTIDGNVFDSSYKRNTPATMRVNQVIKGWSSVLVKMPVGSVWEVYIPQELAYGEQQQREIDPFSTLIFKIELLGIEK